MGEKPHGRRPRTRQKGRETRILSDFLPLWRQKNAAAKSLRVIERQRGESLRGAASGSPHGKARGSGTGETLRRTIMIKTALELWRRLRRSRRGGQHSAFKKYQVAPRLKTEEVRHRVARGLQSAWLEQTHDTRI